MSTGSIRSSSMRTVMAQLRQAGTVDAAGVNRALDAALADGALSGTERRALADLLSSSKFSSDPVRKRLETLLALPDDRLTALAHKLTRADGVIDLQDAKQLVEVARGTQQGVVSLRALHVGSKMTRGASDELKAAEKQQAALDRLDKQPLRTFTLDGKPGADIVSRRTISSVGAPALAAVKDVGGEALSAALKTAATERTALLKSKDPLPATTRVLPEDGSARITVFHMGYGLGADQTGMNFPLQMAQIGKLEGFGIVVRVPGESADDIRAQVKKEKITNVTVMGVAGEGDFWSEDQGDLDVHGNVRVPAPPGDQLPQMQQAAFRERIARAYPADAAAVRRMPWKKLEPLIAKKYPDVQFSMVGAVADRKSHEVLAAAALGKGTKIVANLSHLEGGNVLTGTLPGGQGYALVGRDSLAHSRVILEKDLGRPVSDAELRKFVAHDLGIAPEHVVPVEQPRDFHLDMHMVPIKPGVILMNDPIEAARLSHRWELEDKEKLAPKPPPPGASKEKLAEYADELKFHKELIADFKERHVEDMKRAQKQAAYEARSRADLEAAGLTVVTAPAVFGGHFQSDNFLNAEQGLNPRGERFYIALGGDPRAEKVFLAALEKLDTGIARVHLLDREHTQPTLTAGGGISCRCKAEGSLSG